MSSWKVGKSESAWVMVWQWAQVISVALVSKECKNPLWPHSKQSMLLQSISLLKGCPPDLVLSAGGDVAHPGQRLVPALLNDLQVAHLRTDMPSSVTSPPARYDLVIAARYGMVSPAKVPALQLSKNCHTNIWSSVNPELQPGEDQGFEHQACKPGV